MSNAIQMQQHALDIGQEALDQAVEIPLQQSIELQKSAGKLFLNGLEMSSWLGNRSAELTREALDTYFQTVDNAAQNTTQMTEQGLQRASDIGQQTLQSQQQGFQPGTAFGEQQSTEPQQPVQDQPAGYGREMAPQAARQQPMIQSQPPQMGQPAGQPAAGVSTQEPIRQSAAGVSTHQQPVQGNQTRQPAGQQVRQPPVQRQTQPAPVQEQRPPQQPGRRLAVAGGASEESGGAEAPVDNT